MVCKNCGTEKAHHIADGLYLCAMCEKKEMFVLVRSYETKEYYWKNIKWAIVDEEIVSTK